MENQCRCNHRNDGDTVDVHTGFDGAQNTDCRIPGCVAHGGGAESQKQQIKQVDRFQEKGKIPAAIEEENCRQHENQAVKENASCGLVGVVAESADFLD